MYPSTSTNFTINTPRPPPSAPPQPSLEPPPISIPPSFEFEYPTMNKNTSDKTINLANPKFHFPSPWSTGLCDCWEDFHSCCLTCFCPCITFGRIAEIVDRGSTSCGISGALYGLILCVTGCSCMYSCFYRSKLRGQYFLNEGPCTDCCIHFCCEQCSLCQEYRELKNQGFDMSIGWHGNMERQRRGFAIAPTMEEGMKR